jgi:tetratricopeptide (TPR) repeat protein
MESSASDTIEFAASPSRPPIREPNIYFITLLGLFVVFSMFLSALQWVGTWLGLSRYASLMLGSSMEKTICIAMLLGIVVFVERRSIRSVGLVPLTGLDVGLGLGLFVTLVLVSGGFGFFLFKTVPGFTSGIASEQFKLLSQVPPAFFLLDIFVNGFLEEIGARGYAIDRLQAATGSLLLASVVALLLDLAMHIPFWGWKYTILILPAQTLFVLMYLWRRNISACIIAHITVDAFYVVMIVWGAGILSHFGARGTPTILASQAFARDDYKTAIAEYSKALQQHPTDAKLLWHRAKAEYDDDDLGAALQDLDEVIRRDSANVEAYDTRAMTYYSAHWYEPALSDANQAVSLAPKKSDLYSNRAYVLVEQIQYAKAIADLSDAIKYSYEEDGDLYSRRGLAYLSMRDYDHAIADLTEAIKVNGDHPETLRSRASAYLGKKQDDLAIADLTRALKINPKDIEAYQARSTAYEDLKQYDLAIADLNRAIEVSSYDSTAQNALAWIMSTCPDRKYRNGREALRYASRACFLTSWQDGDSIDTLAAAFAEVGDFSQAVSWEQRALTFMKSANGERQSDAAKRLELYKAKQPFRDTHPVG